MGAVLAKIIEYPKYENPKKVLLLGEDAVGKTTMLYKLNGRGVIYEIPTIGVNLESILYKNLKIVSCDTGIWDYMIKFRIIHPETYGIMFMFDLTDHDRFDDSVKELQNHTSQPETLGLPVLIICNKIDLKLTIDIEKIRETVKPILGGRAWEIIGTSVIKGVGIKECINWISKAVEKK